MSSHGTRNWVDIANAARELLDRLDRHDRPPAGRRRRSCAACGDLGDHSDSCPAVRLRSLLGTVDDSPTADEHRPLWEGGLDDLIDQLDFGDIRDLLSPQLPHGGLQVRVQVVEQ